MKYSVLSPRGEVEGLRPQGLQPRLLSIEGKTIGLLSFFKEHWPLVLEEVQRQLQAKYQRVTFSHYRYVTACSEVLDDPSHNESFLEWLQKVDAVISGYGDAASCTAYVAYNTAAVERCGKPAVMLVNRDFVKTARAASAARSVPRLRLVPTDIPDFSNWFSLEGVLETVIRPKIAKVIDDIVGALCRPLSPEEEIASGGDTPGHSGVVCTGDLREINRFFYTKGWTYGLPIVPPTEEAVTEMLRGTDLPPDYVVAKIPPMLGKATVEKIAVNAVMAGCLPVDMPVLIAAVEALTDPRIQLVAYTCSVASWAPLLVVNGPIRDDLQLNSGAALMTPYYRANAAIGHALGLIIMNIGGVRPGLEDLAVVGHEGRLGMCIAENEEETPWEPLHVQRGFNKTDNTVTLFWPNSRLLLLVEENAANILRTVCDNMPTFGFDPGCMIIIPPRVAKVLAAEGWTKDQVTSYVVEYARRPATEVNLRWLKGNQHVPKEVPLPAEPSRSVRKLFCADNLVVIVAGGNYPALALYGGGGDHGGPVTKRIHLPQDWAALLAQYAATVSKPEYCEA